MTTQEQLAKAVALDSDQSRPNLAEVWAALDSPKFHVVDEDGVNVYGALIRRLARGYWLYVDDCDGYSVLTDAEVAPLIAIPEAAHRPLGWTATGEVVEL